MRAQPRIRHNVVKRNDGAAAVAVQPRTAAFLYVGIMRFLSAAETGGLVELFLWIKFVYAKPDPAFHVELDLSGRGNNGGTAADGGILSKGNGSAHQPCVGMIAQETMNRFQRGMRIGSLMGAANDDIHVETRQTRIHFIKIEIIAGHEPKAQAFDFNHIGLGVFVAVSHVQLVAALQAGFDFAGSGMGLEIPSHNIAAAVKGMGGVAVAVAGFISRVDKHNGMAAYGGLPCFFQYDPVVMGNAGVKMLLVGLERRNVAILRQNDQIHALVALIHHIKHSGKAGFRVLFIGGVPWLNHAGLHRCSHPSVSFSSGRAVF